MSVRAGLTRRRFLEVSSLAAGGLVVSCQLPGRSGGRPATEGASGAFAPNAWISIAPDGSVRFACHRNEMGQDIHTTLTMLVAEELELDPRSIEVRQAAVDPASFTNSLLGAQITGGSTSVRDAWEPLRRASATARTLLVEAAAARWGVPVGECAVEAGKIRHAQHGTLSYGDVVADAAARPVPENVELKPLSAFRVIGRPLRRLDGAAKARGGERYGIDVSLPGMRYAALVACPVLGGKSVAFDRDAALARDGVREVVDLGEAVAVVADDWWTAQSALGALDVRWDEGPAASLDDAALAASLEEGAQEAGAVVKAAGDSAAVLSRAGSSLSARYTTQLLAHMTLEPQNCVAVVSPDGVDVHASTQYPQGAQAAAADAAGVSVERVRVHSQPIGGGFGRRLDVDFVAQAVRIAKALPSGTPVKLVWSREEDTTHDFYRPPSLHVMRGAVEGGAISALEHKLVSPSVTARLFPVFVNEGIDPFMTEGTADLSYSIPNLDLRSVIREVGLRVGYWRSVSHAQNAFAVESFVDELAHASGEDPIALRLAMLKELPRQSAVLRKAVAASGYRPKAVRSKAWGVASMQCYGSHVALVAVVSGTAEALRVEGLHFAVDCGIAIHPDQVVAQIEGAAVSGLMNTIRAKVSLRNGRVEQGNFDDHPIPRMNEVPPIHVMLSDSDEAPGGIGEVGTPLVAPAIANAVFSLTGRRIRSLPLEDSGVRFV